MSSDVAIFPLGAEPNDASDISAQSDEQEPRSDNRQNATRCAELCFSPLQFACLLVVKRPSNMLVHLRDGSAQTILRAATLRQKL